jgi:hypothetical protein
MLLCMVFGFGSQQHLLHPSNCAAAVTSESFIGVCRHTTAVTMRRPAHCMSECEAVQCASRAAAVLLQMYCLLTA